MKTQRAPLRPQIQVCSGLWSIPTSAVRHTIVSTPRPFTRSWMVPERQSTSISGIIVNPLTELLIGDTAECLNFSTLVTGESLVYHTPHTSKVIEIHSQRYTMNNHHSLGTQWNLLISVHCILGYDADMMTVKYCRGFQR